MRAPVPPAPAARACWQCLVEVRVNPFIIFSVGQMLVTLTILLLTTALTRCPRRCISVARQTKVWFLQTVIVQFIFGPSWRLCFRTLLHIEQGGEYAGGSALAFALLLILSFNIWTFYRQITRARRLTRNLEAGETGTTHATAVIDLRGRGSQHIHMMHLAGLVNRASMRSLLNRTGRSARWLRHSVGGDGHLMLDAPSRAVRTPSELRPHGLVTFRDGPDCRGEAQRVAGTTDALEAGQDAAPVSESWQSRAAEESLRLQERMAYLTGRFAKHAPLWQFVTWLRALALMLTAVSARAVLSEDAAVRRAVVYTQAAIALLILVTVARYHRAVSAMCILEPITVCRARVCAKGGGAGLMLALQGAGKLTGACVPPACARAMHGAGAPV